MAVETCRFPKCDCTSANHAKELAEDGRTWFRQALSQSELELIAAAAEAGSVRIPTLGSLAAVLSGQATIASFVSDLLPYARPVRLISFNKTAEQNWALPWHRDRVIAVRHKEDIEGFSNWTNKAGIWHCEPPLFYLERMLFIRIHVDAATERNGPLELALGTHKMGVIPADQAANIAKDAPRELCVAKPGDVLIANALVLHRSLATSEMPPRRALRVDYSADTLPAPLLWALEHAEAAAAPPIVS